MNRVEHTRHVYYIFLESLGYCIWLVWFKYILPVLFCMKIMEKEIERKKENKGPLLLNYSEIYMVSSYLYCICCKSTYTIVMIRNEFMFFFPNIVFPTTDTITSLKYEHVTVQIL